jgi:septum formation protein
MNPSRTVLDDFDATRVTIRSMDEEEIRWYVDTEEPMDKAGSYALQGAGAFFRRESRRRFLRSDRLPLPKVYSLLRRAGVPLRDLQNK